MRKYFIGLLSVIMVGLLVVNNLYMSVSDSIKSENIKQNITNNLLEGFVYEDNGEKTEVFKTALRYLEIDEDLIIRLLENDIVKRYLTDIVNSVYDYRITGDSSYKYSGIEIYNIVDDNIDQVMIDIEYDLSSKDREEVMRYIYNHMDRIIEILYDMDIRGYVS